MKLHVLLMAVAVAATVGGPALAGEHAAKKDAAAERYDADNTGRNVRDRDGKSVTSGDQSEKKSDLKLTQAIRKAVVADDSLSTNAQNVKIITSDGVVTLRGPVKDDEERAKVAAKAEEIAGVGKVKNQLEVTAN